MTAYRPAGPLLRSTVHALASRSAAVFAQGLLGVATLAILSRLLRPADFGLLGMANVLLGFAGIFSQLGVAPALIQRAELRPEHVRVAFTISTATGVAVAAAAWLLAPVIAGFFEEDQVAGVVRALSPTFVIAGQSVVAHALLERRLAYGRLMQIDLTGQTLGSLVTTAALAAMGFGVWALVGGSWAMYLIRAAMFWHLEPHPRGFLLARREARELLSTGGGFTLSRVFHYAASQGDYLVVGRALGPEALGLYTRAYRLMMLPVTYFAGVLARVLFPTIARLQTRPSRLRETYLGASAVAGLVATPLSALMLVAAPDLVRVLLGPGWEGVIAPFRVLACGIVFRAVYPVGDALARGLGLMYRRSVRDALYAVLVVAGSIAGLRFGLTGVAAGVLLAVTVNYLTAASMSLREVRLGWREYVRAQLPGLIIAFLVAGVTLPLRLALAPYLPPLPRLLVISGAGAAVVGGLLAWHPRVAGEHGLAAARALASALASVGFTAGLAHRLARFAGEPPVPAVDPESALDATLDGLPAELTAAAHPRGDDEEQGHGEERQQREEQGRLDEVHGPSLGARRRAGKDD